MRIAVPRERAPGETRVAMTPEAIRRLASDTYRFAVEAGAGEAAFWSDEDYREAGAEVAADRSALLAGGDIVLKVVAPARLDDGSHEADLLPPGCVLIALLRPHFNADLLERLAARGVTALALELMPRITRAQRMDALSAMSTIAGYSAALLGATSVGVFFPMLMTAAGTIAPARVLVLGAGVAGLQAIATARRLGAVVEAFDIRPAVKEQVQSLGATFVEWETEEPTAQLETAGGYAAELSEEHQARERELIGRHVARADVVISTALVPGKPAPRLITAEMVERMRPGSAIVDLAAETGGNCELTVPGKTVREHGVTIHGPLELAASLPVHASQMYARVVSALLGHLIADGRLEIDLEDEITGAICVTHGGEVRFRP
ncbi:MAG: Re/Si-specific NAD(P)(+) transhydrogenase subunit alpha [Gemmatimonadota bacterium]